MTEAEWLECTDPTLMLEFLCETASDRKLRLFAVACCRRIWTSFTDERSRRGVEIAERFADGNATIDELDEACISARRAAWDVYWDVCRQAAWATTWRAMDSENGEDPEQDSGVVRVLESSSRELRRGRRMDEAATNFQDPAALLRDIFGNPFDPVDVDPSWLRPSVVRHAQAIYEQRSFDKMPELAIALEEVGCTNQEILQHCRQEKEHVRGCWFVDLLLGKK